MFIKNSKESKLSTKAFKKRILAEIKKTPDQNRFKAICDLITELAKKNHAKVAPIVFALAENADKISLEAAGIWLEMMLNSFPSKEIPLPLLSLLKKIDAEPSLAICYLITKFSNKDPAELAPIVFALALKTDKISVEAAETCLEMMFYSFPSEEIALPLVSLFSKLNTEPALTQKLDRLYSLVINNGKFASTVSDLSQIPTNDLFAQALFAWGKEKTEKDAEIERLKAELKALKKE